MDKEIFRIEAECLVANKTKIGSQITFGVGAKNTDKGTIVESVVSINVPDQKEANKFEIGKKYVLSINE